MSGENSAGIVFDFAERDGFEPACALQAKAESHRCPKKDQVLLAWSSASLLMCFMLLILVSYFQWQDRHIAA
jgi:hypothetical protein